MNMRYIGEDLIVTLFDVAQLIVAIVHRLNGLLYVVIKFVTF